MARHDRHLSIISFNHSDQAIDLLLQIVSRVGMIDQHSSLIPWPIHLPRPLDVFARYRPCFAPVGASTLSLLALTLAHLCVWSELVPYRSPAKRPLVVWPAIRYSSSMRPGARDKLGSDDPATTHLSDGDTTRAQTHAKGSFRHAFDTLKPYVTMGTTSAEARTRLSSSIERVVSSTSTRANEKRVRSPFALAAWISSRIRRARDRGKSNRRTDRGHVSCREFGWSRAMMNVGATTQDCGSSVYVGNLDEQVSEEILWELFLQVGWFPVLSITCTLQSCQNGRE